LRALGDGRGFGLGWCQYNNFSPQHISSQKKYITNTNLKKGNLVI
jgi:hypothetical protein